MLRPDAGSIGPISPVLKWKVSDGTKKTWKRCAGDLTDDVDDMLDPLEDISQ